MGVRTFAENKELLALACCNLAEDGEQVKWVAERVLAHQAAGVGTTWVEVAEERSVVLLVWLSCLLGVVALRIYVIGDDELDGGLGAAVWVGGADGAVLRDGDHVLPFCGVAVDGGGGGEDYVRDGVLGHAAQKYDSAIDVYAVVFEGLLRGLADSLGGMLVRGHGLAERDYGRNWNRPSVLRELTFKAAKCITLSISGCASKTFSSAGSSVTSTW